MNSILTFDNVSYNYKKNEADVELIKNLSFSIKPGDFVTLMGPKGCGKSTLFSLICSIVSPSSGNIIFNGCHIGYMFQRDRLFEWRTIYYNSSCLDHEYSTDNQVFQNNFKELSKSYGIESMNKNSDTDLSNNLRQRISLIKTLSSDPDLLLLDEPFSSLDCDHRQRVINDVGNIIRHEGKTTLMITHDITEAVLLSDKIIILSKNPCSIYKIIPVYLSIEERLSPNRRSLQKFQDTYNCVLQDLSLCSTNK